MEKYDIFSITSEVITGTPTGTDKYIAAGNGKWTASSSNTKAFAEFIGSDVQDGVTFYAFSVL